MISTFWPSILTPCYWPLDIIHHFLNCFHCIHMSIFFKRSTLEFASWLHLPKYPVSIQKSTMFLFHTRSIWLWSRPQIFPFSLLVSCDDVVAVVTISSSSITPQGCTFCWWCSSRRKEYIYPFSHSIFMEKDHIVKQNSLPSFQWIILCYDNC